jgi:large subunit ribosomal protein L18
MIIKEDKNVNRKVRHLRVRKKVSGTAQRPRLCVFKSLNEIYAQIIDDTKSVTLLSASSKEKALVAQMQGKSKTEQAKIIGETIAKRALEQKIESIVFDRSGYIYTGRIAAVAEGARSQGLKF